MEFKNFDTGNIKNLLDRYFKVKIIPAKTLFIVNPNWDNLKTDSCPWCNRRIYIIMKTGRRYCKNKKCPTDTKFTMSESAYNELKGKIKNQ